MLLNKYYSEKPVYSKIGRGRLQGILDLAGNLNGKKVLDIGCGGGELGRELKKRFSSVQVYGVDVSPAAIVEARKYLDWVAVADLTADWLADLNESDFDLIVVSEVLEHLFWPEKLLTQIREKFQSQAIITVPNILFWKNRIKIILGHFEYANTGLMDRGHIHFFSWRSFNQIVSESGYRIEKGANHLPTRGTKFLGKIWPGLFAFQFIAKISPNKVESI